MLVRKNVHIEWNQDEREIKRTKKIIIAIPDVENKFKPNIYCIKFYWRMFAVKVEF